MISKILKDNIIYIISIVLMILAFSLILNSSLLTSIINIDYSIIKTMTSIVNDKLIIIFKIITEMGNFYIPIIIVISMFLFIKNKWYCYILSSSYLLAGIITYLSKIIISRDRPLIALIDIPKSFSFPSGHTLTSLVFYIVLCYLLIKKFKIKKELIMYIVFSILVILIAFSRIYLGVHFFTDVIGGFIIGIPVLFMILNIINKYFKEKLK